MIIIHELDGYKHIGGHPADKSKNFRKNLTFIAFEITDWNTDKNMLSFLSVHMDSDRVESIIELLEGKVKNNKIGIHYLVVRQDDDNDKYYGNETMMLTNVRPAEIDKVLAFGKENYND